MNRNHEMNEHYEKRFGMTAVRMGLITTDELVEALRVQIYEDLDGMPHRLIGEILLDEEALTSEEIVAVRRALFQDEVQEWVQNKEATREAVVRFPQLVKG